MRRRTGKEPHGTVEAGSSREKEIQAELRKSPARSGMPGWAAFFVFLTALFLGLDFRGVTGRVVDILDNRGGLVPLGIYLFTWLGLIVSLVILYTSRFRTVRLFSYLLTLLSIAVFAGFRFANGSGYGYFEAMYSVNEFELAGEAFREYRGASLAGILTGSLAAAVIAWISETRLKEAAAKSLVAVLVFTGCMGYIVSRNIDLAIGNFPVVFNLPAITVQALIHRLYIGPREKPGMEPVDPGMAQHLILVMDESIRGDQLGIDNPGLGTTPYLQELDGRVLNLGIACSAGNNSGISNIIVQSGLGLGQVPDLGQLALKRPSIFQYARQANRKTCFINSQKAKFDNYMGLYDYRDIDRFIHIGEAFPELPKWMHDQAAAQCIVDFLDTPDQTFTYVVKYGAHFPYCKMYPHDGGEPALLRVVPESDFSGEENPEDEFSDYRNAVRWSVDEFFRKLIPGLEGKDYLLFYISDHGQSLDSHRGLLNPTPHNTPEHPPSEQAVTPMFMIASRPDGTALNPELVSRMLANRDRLSHFQVFPTLLCFLGYDRKEINECYGATVFDQVPEERYFVSGDLFGRDKCEKNLFRKDGPG